MFARILYHSYKWFHVIRIWRTRHFTSAGAAMTMALFFPWLFGFNILKTTVYQVLSFCASIMTVSIVLSLNPFKFNVKVNRLLPDYATARDQVFYEIEITNLSEKTQKGLFLFEDMVDPSPDVTSLLTTREPFEHLRNAWDRKILYYRWQWLVKKNQKIQLQTIALPDLPAGETIRVKSSFMPLYRGYVQFTGMTFARPDILGLFSRLLSINNSQKILILPRRYKLKKVNLMSSRQYHPGGINLASSIGNSEEFMSLRQYRPGDPLRNIHWRTFAKTNEIVIKEFEDEYFVRHALILDTFLTSDNESVFEDAVSTASSYISSMQPHESIIDLMFVGHQVYSFKSGRGLAHSEKMLEILACVEPCKDKDILELLPNLQTNIKRFSGSICVFLGWEKGHRKIYQLFEQAQIPLCVIVITEDKQKMKEKIASSLTSYDQIKVVQTGQIEKELGDG